MVCNNNPNDRATFSLNIILPKGMQSIASGKLLGLEEELDKVIYKWHQDYETPTYTYGFVIGSFTEVTEQIDDVKLHYYSSELNENELKRVFNETSNILKFFEQKSGIEYIQDSYSQILIGNNYQEMSGLSVLSESYPTYVFKDSSEIHLTSHELAHQWWGNMITCEDFGHFWLNEAFAVYMSSAFSEHKFGKEKYQSDISIYKSIYDDLVERGKDRPLIFKEWKSSRDNRNIVYYKGAYVLHLLREELGEEDFWKGIQSYSKRYFGKSVKTEDFKLAMEEATGSDLESFFDSWVYKKER
jgi:aminopeptidase N